jgi:Tfp pilus assembly protein PilE
MILPHSPVARQDGFTFIELMGVTAITTNPAAAVIRQYFRSIKITGALSVVGHFRIAAGARSCRHRGQQRPGLQYLHHRRRLHRHLKGEAP